MLNHNNTIKSGNEHGRSLTRDSTCVLFTSYWSVREPETQVETFAPDYSSMYVSEVYAGPECPPGPASPGSGRDWIPGLNSMYPGAGWEPGGSRAGAGREPGGSREHILLPRAGIKVLFAGNWPGAGPGQSYCPGLGKSRISRLFNIFNLYKQEYVVSTN